MARAFYTRKVYHIPLRLSRGFLVSVSPNFDSLSSFPPALWKTVPHSDNSTALLTSFVENLPEHKIYPLKCALSPPEAQNNALFCPFFLHNLWKTHFENSRITPPYPPFPRNFPGFPHDFSTSLGESTRLSHDFAFVILNILCPFSLQIFLFHIWDFSCISGIFVLYYMQYLDTLCLDTMIT